jgi:hypothetical protein
MTTIHSGPAIRRRFHKDYIAAYGGLLAQRIRLGGRVPDLPLSH